MAPPWTEERLENRLSTMVRFRQLQKMAFPLTSGLEPSEKELSMISREAEIPWMEFLVP